MTFERASRATCVAVWLLLSAAATAVAATPAPDAVNPASVEPVAEQATPAPAAAASPVLTNEPLDAPPVLPAAPAASAAAPVPAPTPAPTSATPTGPARAFEQTLRAARLGQPDAMWDVADSYGAGRGVPRDLLASCIWMLRVRDHSGDDKLVEQATQVLPYMERALTLVQMATCHKHGSIWPPEATEAGMADAIQPVPSPALREHCVTRVTKVGKKSKKSTVCKAVRSGSGKSGKVTTGKKSKAVKAAGAKKRHATGAAR